MYLSEGMRLVRDLCETRGKLRRICRDLAGVLDAFRCIRCISSVIQHMVGKVGKVGMVHGTPKSRGSFYQKSINLNYYPLSMRHLVRIR